VISGHTELALEQSQPGEQIYQDLLEIQSAAARSANLTRQLLAFARKQTVCPVLLDLNDTVGSMLKMLQRLIGEDIELAWLPGHDLWPVKIDPSQVDQILANLAVNARDAITGVGQLTIETANVDLDEEYCANHLGFVRGQYVQLEVSDNGCGMDSKILAHIFEPFFTTKKEGQGTGLGLATVYGIVKQNQGFINVYSEPGQGTTIRIYLPRVKMEAMGTRPETSREEPPRGAETILIVEDDPAILDISKRFIERFGYKVLTAASPKLALKLVEEFTGTIDLLITDVVMPEMNGKELARLLQEMKPGIKCLFMSGYTADAIARQGILDEGICFLPKPFSSREIALKIREALKQPE
jgi:CheY-like chemotaxis protein